MIVSDNFYIICPISLFLIQNYRDLNKRVQNIPQALLFLQQLIIMYKNGIILCSKKYVYFVQINNIMIQKLTKIRI